MTSKEEYLKRYLSGNSKDEKKSKKRREKQKSSQTRFKIIEDDVDIPHSTLKPETKYKTEEIILEDEDADEDDIQPVVELINCQTDELKMFGKFKTDNWKSLQKDGETATTSSRMRHDSDDNSPPRRRYDSGDHSPIRRRRYSDDQSPPRRRHDSGDQSPRRRRHDSGDNSSVRRRRSSNDQSPPRRKEHNSIQRRQRHDSGGDSPPASRKGMTDQSPPRRQRHDSGDHSPPRRRRRDDSDNESFPAQKISEDVSGRNAKATVRPKMTLSKSKRKEPTEEQKQRAEEMAKKYAVWNKGQKQVKDRQEKLNEMVAETSKPFARHRGDEDLEDHLKNIEYNDDPMLQYMREKKAKETGAVSKPKYNGPCPPNRYGIAPGYRWDGVDRSTGFEVKLMAQKNVKKAEEEEFYKWSSGRYE